MNPLIFLIIFHSIFSHSINYNILGSIESGFSTVYHDITNAVSSGVKGAISWGSGIAKGLIQSAQNVFIGSFISYIVAPVVKYFSNGLLDLIRYIKESMGDIFGILIGVPLGLIQYITGFLNSLGIFGLPVIMAITGIFIVVIVAICLGIIKLVQTLGELL